MALSDILAQLFAQNSNQTGAAQPAPATPPQDYNDFVSRLMAQANAGIDARGPSRGLFSAITGDDRKAALANVTANAPSAWQQFQQAQSATQNAGLGTATNLARTGALTGTNIDPNNINASIPAMTAAYGGALNGTPSSPQPSAQAPPVDPVQAHRAMLLRLANFASMSGDNASSKDFFTQASAGDPDGTVTRPDGAVGDGVTGQPVGMSVGQLLALRAGGVSGAQSNAELPAKLIGQTHQGNVDVGVHSANTATDSAHTLVNGIDTTTGLPVTRTQADLLSNGTKNFAASNPYFDGQQAELKDLRGKSENADQGLDIAQQISNAANGVYTGKGNAELQNLRKTVQAVSQMTGASVDPSINNDTAKVEQLKFASQQLVAIAMHGLTSRPAQSIYNQIAAVKPGDLSSMQGLRAIINNQIVPMLQRDKAVYSGTSAYYQKNPMRNDAAAVVPGQVPLEKFGVRPVQAAQPGDYFIDPRDGRLRQRPVH